MKTLLLVSALLSASAFAAPATPVTSKIQDCFKIKNALDKKYCMDKYLESVKLTLGTEKKTWAKGLSKQEKEEKTAELSQELQAKKDHDLILQQEIALTQKHLDDLTAVKVTKEAKKEVKKEKKKKKDKDKGFRIKL